MGRSGILRCDYLGRRGRPRRGEELSRRPATSPRSILKKPAGATSMGEVDERVVRRRRWEVARGGGLGRGCRRSAGVRDIRVSRKEAEGESDEGDDSEDDEDGDDGEGEGDDNGGNEEGRGGDDGRGRRVKEEELRRLGGVDLLGGVEGDDEDEDGENEESEGEGSSDSSYSDLIGIEPESLSRERRNTFFGSNPGTF